jgi:hypothetical protein
MVQYFPVSEYPRGFVPAEGGGHWLAEIDSLTSPADHLMKYEILTHVIMDNDRLSRTTLDNIHRIASDHRVSFKV